MKTYLFAISLVTVAALFPGGRSAGAATAPNIGDTNEVSLDMVLSEVRRNNPALKATRANWEAMKQRIPQARAWEDLRAGVDVERSGTTRFDNYTDTEWMVSQEIPLSGKNRLRARVAGADAAGALMELHGREIELAARARRAWFRMANAYAQLDLNRKNLDLWKQFSDSSRSKYELGIQTQADVLMAETELGKLQEIRFDFERQIAESESELNVLMNRATHAPLGRPAPLTVAALPGSLADLQQAALAQRPDLHLAQKKIEAAKARVALARREWIPDPEIRVEARHFDGGSKTIQEYDTGIFLRIPWANRSKYRAAIEEAKSVLESSEHEFEARWVEALGMIRNQFKKIEMLRHHYELFSDKLVPLARQTVEARRLNYENARASLLELLTAQRTAQETESAMQQHLADYLAALAELEAMVGATPFPAPPNGRSQN